MKIIFNFVKVEIIYPDNQGAFTYSTLMCSSANQYSFVAENPSSSQQGQTSTFTLNPGANNIGNLQACGTSTEEYCNLIIDNQNYILGPVVGIYNSQAYSNHTVGVLYGTSLSADLSTQTNAGFINYGDYFGMLFSHSQPTGSIGNSNYVYYLNVVPGTDNPNTARMQLSPSTTQTLGSPGSVPVTITEYGQLGGFISGYFNGTLYSTLAGSSNNPYHVICNFRMKKYN